LPYINLVFRRNSHGPFELIGDVHGFPDELVDLLAKLGYETAKSAGPWKSSGLDWSTP
jgi:hypothetical protein